MGFKLTLCCIFICIVLSISTVTSVEYPSEKPSVDSGQKVYTMNCAGCHGIKGDGSVLKGAPDFTDQNTMINKNSSLFFDAVSGGISGTAMTGFGSLSVSERWDVVAYIWTFWADSDSAVRGKKIYESKCFTCHGIKGDGSGRPGARDFTKPENMVKPPSVFFNSVSEGVPNSAMRPWKSVLSENERWDAVKYVWTFQFKDYIASSEQTKSTPVGNGLILISFALAICFIFLSGKRKLKIKKL